MRLVLIALHAFDHLGSVALPSWALHLGDCSENRDGVKSRSAPRDGSSRVSRNFPGILEQRRSATLAASAIHSAGALH